MLLLKILQKVVKMTERITKVVKIFKWHCSHILEGHEGLCKNLHGHTYKLEVEVSGFPKSFSYKNKKDGMVIDFGELKKIVKEQIVDKFDHAIIIDNRNEDLINFCEKQQYKILKLPYKTTAENMVNWIFEKLISVFQLNIGYSLTRVRLWETDTSYAEVKE